jgi:Cu/Ag efflux pump CusA
MRKELKKNLAFCVIGWPLIAIGICLLVFANLWGLIPLIAGVIILDVSAFKLMLENNKKKKAEQKEEETTGKKVWKVILEILKYIGVILFGAFVVLYRICKKLLKLGKIKRKYKLLMPFTETAGFDLLISFVVFVVFLLAALICYEIAQAIK